MIRARMSRTASNRGVVLIICAAVLAVLALLAVSFARLMTLELRATSSFVSGVRAQFIAHSGVARAIEELRRRASGRPWDDPAKDTWLYKDTVPIEDSLEPSFKQGVHPFNKDAYSGVLGDGLKGPYEHNAGRFEEKGDYYKLKIVDAGSQINLNSEQRTLPAILENLGKALAYFARTNRDYTRKNPRAINPVPSAGNEMSDGVASTGRGTGLAILEERDKLPSRRFTTKEELIPIIGPEAFRAIEDHVAIHSWGDPDTVSPNLSGLVATDAREVAPGFAREFRHPVNLNTAPEPVLAAVLAGIGASVPVVTNSKHSLGPVMDFSFREEKELAYEPTYMRIPRVSPTQAREIAKEIVRARARAPFKSWEAFEDFVDLLPSTSAYFPSFVNAPPNIRTEPTKGAAWWYERTKDMVKANANPNLRRNKFNPNVAVGLTVDKGDLWEYALGHPLAVGARKDLVAAHTTDFSFSSMGFFEITSLGRVTSGGGDIIAAAKLRVVVQVYSVFRHTTQEHFERDVAAGTQTLFKPQFFLVSSYPEFIRAKLGYKGNASTIDGYLAQEPRDASLVTNFQTQQLYGTMRSHFDENLGPFGKPQNNLFRQADGQTPQAQWVRELFACTGDRDSEIPVESRSIERDKWNAPEGNSVGRDGFFASGLMSKYGRFLFYPTFYPLNRPADAFPNYLPGGNAPAYEGAAEFFVKLREDATEKIPAGLCGATVVTRQTGGVNTGGVQWYLFKNTLGQLRVTRLYFERAFDEKGSNEVGLPKVELAQRRAPIDPADPKSGYVFRVARTDMIVDVRDWRAREWHHVALLWDDELPDRAKLRVWIDGEERSALPEVLPNDPDPLKRYPSFVRLNERNPKNALFAAGFVRRQMRQDGIFKYAVEVQSYANGTIDTFNVYQNPIVFQSGAMIPPSRFSPLGSYKNALAPNYSRDVPVGSISYTVYRPKRNPFRNDAGAAKYDDSTKPYVDLQVEIETPGGTKRIDIPYFKSRGASDEMKEALKAGGMIRYTLTFRGHKLASSPRLASPIVDDVTAVFLTDPVILSWEWVLGN